MTEETTIRQTAAEATNVVPSGQPAPTVGAHSGAERNDKRPTVSWAALLDEAVSKPGYIHQAYSRFHNYSLGNQLLALFQCFEHGIQPGPLASFLKWKDLGRHVKKGEKAMTLCMPVTCKRTRAVKQDDGTEQEEEFTYTHFTYKPHWFVLSQTEGAEYQPPTIPEWNEQKALAALNIERVPFEDLNGNAQGYARRGGKIAINPLAALPFKTLMHELAHSILHCNERDMADTDQTPRSVAEVEAGTHSAWVSRLLEGFGHTVLVANSRELPGISHSNNKSDTRDAEMLARYARHDPKLLSPIHHRSEDAQLDLAMIRVRERLVVVRTMLINATRGLVKCFGYRLRGCSADCFAQRSRTQLPEALRQTLLPLLDQIRTLTAQIRTFDQQIEKLASAKYPETEALRQVNGVGALTAVTFVLTVGDPKRFAKSRDVGCYLGLRPRKSQSGRRDPQLGITKAGDCYLRKTLVQCAQYIVGPFGRDCRLRRWGLKLAQRGSKNAKKRAIVAVARKLAVLLHRLWVTQQPYEPFFGMSAEQISLF